MACACAGLLAFQTPVLAQGHGPSAYSKPELMEPRVGGPIGPPDAWTTLPMGASPRGVGTFTWDNGAPLIDFRDPASQLSEAPAVPLYRFIAAAADDFIIIDGVNPASNARITSVRVAFTFFDSGSGSATPTTTWNSVFVTIYPNNPSGGDHPDGQPDNMGGHTGNVHFSQEVPAAMLLNETFSGTVNICRPYYQVDIPVDIVIQKNVKYWLSVVPRYPAPPQTAWCNSQVNTNSIAKYGFPVPFNVPFWTDVPGNQNHPNCAAHNPPPAGTNKNLSFVIEAEDLAVIPGACCNQETGICADVMHPSDCTGPFEVFSLGETCASITCAAVTGACCDDTNPPCVEGVNIAACQGSNQRFAAGLTCAELDPPCGTTDPGACCLANGSCMNLAPTACYHAGGQWNAGDCSTFFCPPLNDDCANAQNVSNDLLAFDTRGATTDGPAEVCATLDNDIWYAYTATCDGTLTVNLCTTTNYDSAVAVYDGCACPPSLGTPLGCNNDFCGARSYVTIPVTNSNCYLIRVGGSAGANGTGQMEVTCIPTGSGACCHSSISCEILTESNCMNSGDVYTEGQPCSEITCQSPPVNDACVDKITYGTVHVAVPFDTTFALTEPGAPQTGCGPIEKDIWYNYQANCTGPAHVTVSTIGSSFDTVVALYGPAPGGCPHPALCPAVDFSELACNDDATPSLTGSYLTVTVDANDCIKIRVGGNVDGPGGGGPGWIEIDCVETEWGACCHSDGTCDLEDVLSCVEPGDVFTMHQPCNVLTCPPIGACCLSGGACQVLSESNCAGLSGVYQGDGSACTPSLCPDVGPACCLGDIDDDCDLDELDIPGFVDALINPPLIGAPEFCRADVNQDNVIDGLDVAIFVEKLLAGLSCTPACCPGDTNGDGLLDGLDVQGLLDAVLSPPVCGTLAFCRADVDGNEIIDIFDVDALANKLVAGDACPP